MLRPRRMKKARIIVLRSSIESLVKDLHEAGLVDIRKAKYEELEEGRPLASFDEVSAQLLKLRTVRSMMKPHLKGGPTEEPEILSTEEALSQAKTLEVSEHLKGLSGEASQLSERMTALEADALVVEKLLDFRKVDFSKLETKTIGYRVGEISSMKAAELDKKLEKMEGESTVISDVPSDTTLVLFEKRKAEDVDTVLADMGFRPIEVPEGTTTPISTADRIKHEFDSKKTRLAIVNKELEKLSKDNVAKVSSLLASLRIESERAEIASRFASSKSTYVIEGWILEEEFSNLASVVEKYGSSAMLQEAGFGHKDVPPTVLGNPKIASGFEYLTKSYSLPNYFEFDPTMAYFIGLPIIYGMIVGDFIYGLISIALGWWMMKKFEKSYTMRNVAAIWFLSGFVTLIFGVIYDEFGGFTHQMLINYLGSWLGMGQVLSAPLYDGFLRMKNILPLVAMTALVGMIHLAFGFIIGAINEWNHNRKHSIAKIAWLGVELGMLMALLPAIGMADDAFMMAGIVLLALCVIILGITEGIIGIIELPGLLGNILSYTRIAAIGIVGIVIAEFLLNQFILPIPEQGIFAIVLLPLFLLFHVVNAFLAMFESLVQGGRLNIVEFRSKFLHGGGEVFSPFMLKKY
jgi:V/A-type H+-transporting ATPase subunit I